MFYQVLPRVTGFYRVLPSFTEFYRVVFAIVAVVVGSFTVFFPFDVTVHVVDAFGMPGMLS